MEQHVSSWFVRLAVEQAFLPAGTGDFPVASSEHGTGMSRKPAGWKACATPQTRAPERASVRRSRLSSEQFMSYF